MADEKSLHDSLASAFDEVSKAEGLDESVDKAPQPVAAETPESSALETPAQTRERDEQGRFAKKLDSPQEKPAVAEPPPIQVPQPLQTEAPQQPQRTYMPPPGWSVPAKAEFDKLPPQVKEAIARREEEVSNGFRAYGERMQSFKGLEPYVEMANQAGTTVADAYGRFMDAEQRLAQDFPSGIRHLCEYFKWDPAQLVAALSQGGYQQPNLQSSPEFSAIKAEIDKLKAEREQERNAGINADIEHFASKPENRYFDNVREYMATLLSSGKAQTLEDAYDKACWADPQIRTLRIQEQSQEQAAAAQKRASDARRAAGSLSPGAPIPGVGNNAGGTASKKSLREQIIENYSEAQI